MYTFYFGYPTPPPPSSTLERCVAPVGETTSTQNLGEFEQSDYGDNAQSPLLIILNVIQTALGYITSPEKDRVRVRVKG